MATIKSGDQNEYATENRGQAEYNKGLEIIANLKNENESITAARHFIKALDLGCDEFNQDWIGWSTLAQYYFKQNEYEQARQAASNVLKHNPPSNMEAESILLLAKIAINENKFEELFDLSIRGLNIQTIDNQYKCYFYFFKGEALGLISTKLWESNNYKKEELKKHIEDAINAYRSCLGLASKNKGQIFSDLRDDSAVKLSNMLKFKKSVIGGCFIATAVFGDPYASEVIKLNEFRDNYLLKFSSGKTFVKLYYKFSPPIANLIANKTILKKITKFLIIIPIIKIANIIKKRRNNHGNN